MSKKNDNLERELRRLDPVEPGELDGAADSPDAASLLASIVATDPGAVADREAAPDQEAMPAARRSRRRLPRLVLPAAAAAAMAVAIAVLLIVLGLPSGGGGDEHGLAASLDAAAAAAAKAAPPTADPYTYLKTREVSINTNGADRRSWKVLQSTTREEWVTQEGAGRLKVTDGPSRFVDAADKAEWEGAGEPRFLTLGFGRRTEDRWVDAAMLRGGPEELTPEPALLTARLTAMAEVEPGKTPVNAATLGLIAERLRDPGASPALRRALYAAIKRVPGIRYFGPATDPAGRQGVAVGVTEPVDGTPTRFSLIFDPDTSQALATETTSLATGTGVGPTMLKARVYLKARGIGSLTGNGGAWIEGFDPSAATDRDYLIYRIPEVGAS
jgi:hypothetical protein